MAITKDSGVRSNAAIDLAELPPEDRDLVYRRQTAAGQIPGMQGVDLPINQTPHEEPHVAPLWVMWGTFIALIFLTILTVAAREIDLGAANVWIALGLAGVKALLVVFFFMHLWWDSKFNQLVLVTAIVFLVLLISFTIVDSGQYQPTIEPADAYRQELVAGDAG